MYVVETRGRGNYVPPHHRGSGRTQFDGLSASAQVFKPGAEVRGHFKVSGFSAPAQAAEAFATFKRVANRWVPGEGDLSYTYSYTAAAPDAPVNGTEITVQSFMAGGESPDEVEEGFRRAARAASSAAGGKIVYDGGEYLNKDLIEPSPPPPAEPDETGEPIEITGRPFANVGKWLIPLGIGAVAAVGIYAASQTKWGKKQTRKVKRAFK